MTNPPQVIMSWERRGMDSTRSFFPQNFAWPVLKITFFPLALKPEGLATYLFYTILLLLIRRKKLYKISIWLKPRVHELKRKKTKTWTGIGLKFLLSNCVLMYAMYTNFQGCTTIFAVSGAVHIAAIFIVADCRYLS